MRKSTLKDTGLGERGRKNTLASWILGSGRRMGETILHFGHGLDRLWNESGSWRIQMSNKTIYGSIAKVLWQILFFFIQ